MSCIFDLFWIEHMESNHRIPKQCVQTVVVRVAYHQSAIIICVCPMPYREAEGRQHRCQPPQCGRKQADAR
uniref:Uncharacterized protein n=1 Tax=Triticum urartu TaxID=4572 RepID=A0A8R7PAR6_TRIUA